MFFIGHETEENINGEPPPIIYIKGSRNHFHNTLLKLIHKLRLKIFEINIRELGITTDDSISSTDIIFKIQDKIELSYRIGALMVGIKYENFIDILFELEQLAFKNSTVFFEYEWIKNLFNGAIIIESSDDC